ncbi:hypothetical protein Dform_00247 [Dehalogenimonas formicexedens]|uniref:DUF4395 domain-containing protein n=1 Tax=Dehalogenimonas formicexedens TaxID=1839801 RepID=A0A1P8F5A2_9CHLR|nr:DUF4395 domain-containing protein [Dehalogenimonas formicexedens]APV43610.1 hypothetical protein Dform_00247 [Dehalogenimonas formicexedens]
MAKEKMFGERVEGYEVPVLNEREIRASAGILFLFMFMAFMSIVFDENFLLIKYVITAFVVDFSSRIFFNPKFAPSLIIGRLIVGRQTPEYVGAAQKKFAWTIGWVLATIMFLLMVLMNSYSFITGLICWTCMIFTFFESVFGICLGCMFYGKFNKKKTRYCPGDVCVVKIRQPIQKTSSGQVAIVVGFFIFMASVAALFNGHLSANPTDLFGSTQISEMSEPR